jgi:hypothetical protein
VHWQYIIVMARQLPYQIALSKTPNAAHSEHMPVHALDFPPLNRICPLQPNQSLIMNRKHPLFARYRQSHSPHLCRDESTIRRYPSQNDQLFHGRKLDVKRGDERSGKCAAVFCVGAIETIPWIQQEIPNDLTGGMAT